MKDKSLEEVLAKLQYFNEKKFSIHNDNVILKENKKDGKVENAHSVGNNRLVLSALYTF